MWAATFTLRCVGPKHFLLCQNSRICHAELKLWVWYTCLPVCVWVVCVFAQSSRRNVRYQFAPHLSRLCRQQARNFRMVRTPNRVLSSSPCDGCFCSSKTKHGAKTRTICFCRRLQQQNPKLRKAVLSRSSSDVFCIVGTNDCIRT